jgi:hypothetical protein
LGQKKNSRESKNTAGKNSREHREPKTGAKIALKGGKVGGN